MKRTPSIILAVVILAVIVGGGYALFHKPKKSGTSTSTTSSTQAPPVNNAVIITKTDNSVGQYLAEPNGKPLYTYNLDTSGVSKCTGSCLVAWPAYVDSGSTANLPAGIATIKRTDNGAMQYTYNGMPLYTFEGDSNNQVTGNGVQDFAIAKPAGAASSSSSSSSNW